MSVNINDLFQHLMEDPDIIPPEGEDKEDIAMAMARQRAKQANNNTKALSMAKEDRGISKLLAFLVKAEGDLSEEGQEKETPEDKELRESKQYIADFGKHENNFRIHGKKVLAASKTGRSPWQTRKQAEAATAKNEKRPVKTVEREDETSYRGKVHKKEWEDAHAFLTTHAKGVVKQHEKDLDAAIAAGQEPEYVDVVSEGEGGDIEAPATASQKPPAERIAWATAEEEEKRKEGMTTAEKRADAKIRAAAAGDEQADEAAKELAAREALASQVSAKVKDIADGAPKEDVDHPFYHGKFGGGYDAEGNPDEKRKAYDNLVEKFGLDFLEAAHDWYVRPMKDKGKPVEDGGDGLPGRAWNDNPTFHHGGGKPENNIVPDVVNRMALSYQAALEDKAKEAQRVEGLPIEVATPSGDMTDEEKLAAFSGKPTRLAQETAAYHEKMDNLLNRFKDGFSSANLNDTHQQRTRKNSVRNKNPDAATAFDKMREAWSDLGLEAQLDADDIDKSEYYEKLDNFIRDNKDTLNQHYALTTKARITEGQIPTVPKDSPTEEAQNNIIEITTSPNAEEELPNEVAEASQQIVIGTDSPKKKQSKVRALKEFATEAASQVNIEFTPQSDDAINEEIARVTAEGVASGEQPNEVLSDIEDLVGDEKAQQIIIDHDVPKSDRRMSRGAKKFFKTNGIDPDGPGVAHIENLKEAKKHVEDNTPEPAHVTAIREREAAAGTARVQADRDREHKELVDKLRNVNTTDKEAAVADLHAMGERHSPGGGGDAAVQRAREDLEGIAPDDPAGAANNPDMHRALGGTPLKERIADASRKAGEEVERLKTEAAAAAENEAVAEAAVKAEEAAVKAAEKEPAEKEPELGQQQLDLPFEDEEVPPTEETPGEAPKVSREDFLDSWKETKWRRKAYGIENQHAENHDVDMAMDQNELLDDAGVGLNDSFTDRDGNVLSRGDLETARMNARTLNPAMVGIRDYLNDNPDATEVPEDMAENMFGKHGAFLPLKRGSDGKMEDPQINPKLKELEEDFADHVDNPEKFIAPEEVKPTEETSDEASQAKPKPESTEERKIEIAPPAPPAPEAPKADTEPVGDEAPKRQPRLGQQPVTREEGQQSRMPLDRPERQADRHLMETRPVRTGQIADVPRPGGEEEEADPERKKVKREEGQQSFEDYRDSVQAIKDKERDEEAREAAKGQPSSIDKMRQQLKDKFNQEHEHVDALSDEEVIKDHKQYQQDLNRQRARNQITTGHSKEDVFKAMAKAHGRDLDEGYLQTLRDNHQFHDVKELTKIHVDAQKQRDDAKFEHESNDAISSALNMNELPEEGLDKLHAMDRVRDIAKKLNTHTRAVDRGGKPLLDLNAQRHLKTLLSDAIDKGDLDPEEYEGIAREADEMGEKFLNDDHRASIDADNTKKRARHEDFLDHAEGMEEHDLDRRGHNLNDTKGDEGHHYDKNEDGTVGKRNGASYHYRDEDGSLKQVEGKDIARSVNHAAYGREAQHPPKLLGLDETGKKEQQEHFKLMKKAASATEPLSDGEIDRFKELETNNPALATSQYKGLLLGVQRQMMNGEDGTDVKNRMGIPEEDHDEADKSSCLAPVGEPHPGIDKVWNPATHRWCDKEYLDDLKGSLKKGEAIHFPLGLHHGAVDKDGNSLEHLDKDSDGNVQGSYVTPSGAFPSNSSTGGSKEMQSHDKPVTHGDVAWHNLKDVAHGEKIDENTQRALGHYNSDKHTPEGQRSGAADRFKGVIGKFGRILQKNKEREQGRPNVTGLDRQRSRRGTDGSAVSSLLKRIGTYTKEGFKEAGSTIGDTGGLAGLVAGRAIRSTDYYKDKQVREAVKRVQVQESAAQKLTDRVIRVRGENK